MNDEIKKEFTQEIGVVIERAQGLVKAAVSLIAPETNYIINNSITDGKQIEALLDKLIDYAGMDDDALLLFRRLCRHYYFINPRVTAEFVYSYRDMYGSEEADEDDEKT